MFHLVVIPGILPARPIGATVPVTVVQRKERAHASMKSEKSRDAQQSDVTEQSPSLPLQDEAEALSMLYEQFRRPIHSYIYRLLGSQEDADDVTQEVFVRACIAWKGLYDRTHLSAWLYRIATNLCVDLLRRRKRISWWPLGQRFHANGNSAETESGIADESMALLSNTGGIPEIAEREHIRLALARMPHEYAIVLVLSAAQGVPYQEIAAIVGISPNAAATRISRAKRMFAEQYQRISQEDSQTEEMQR